MKKEVNWNRTEKNKARLIAVNPDGTTKKIAVFFPSHSCIDLDLCLLNKMINKHTFLILIEKVEKRVKAIELFLKSKGITRYYIHKKPVEKLNLVTILKGRKVDYIFFDICGNLTAQVTNWFYENQDNFAENMRMPITLKITSRRKEFKKAIKKSLKDKSRPDFMLPTNNNLLNSKVESPNLIKDLKNICKAIFYSFSKRHIEITKLFTYQDSRSPMVLIDMIVGKNKEEDNTFEEIRKRYSYKVSYTRRVVKITKTKKLKKRGPKSKKKQIFKITNAYGIARDLGIFGNFESIKDVPKGKRAHIKIKAKKIGIDPDIALKRITKRLDKYKLSA